MKWERFKKNSGMLVQIEPPECILDINSHVLPERRDDWSIESFPETDVVLLRNTKTNQAIKLGKDHIYDFRSNPNRLEDDKSFGFLTLKVQVFINDKEIWLRPNYRPGDRVSPSGSSHHKVQWTPYFHIDTTSFAPPTATSIKIQYRLWSDDAAIPLLIRVASEPDGNGLTQELSGAAGVIDQMLHSTNLYFSLSHPLVHYQLQGMGWEDSI